MITIKRNDTARKISDTLLLDGAAIDLTGSTVKFVMKPKGSGDIIKKNATIVTAPAGKVEYQFETGDTQNAGGYFIEWEITFSGGAVLTVPDDGYSELTILEDLG